MGGQRFEVYLPHTTFGPVPARLSFSFSLNSLYEEVGLTKNSVETVKQKTAKQKKNVSPLSRIAAI